MNVRAAVVIGWLKVLLSLVWAGLALAGLFLGQRLYAWGQEMLTETLLPVQEDLVLVRSALLETGAALSTAEEALATAQEIAATAAQTLEHSRASVDDVHYLVAEEAPATLREINAAMPAVIEAAAAVDQTLSFLAGLNLTFPNPFGDNWSIGLGVEYAPPVPLDAALEDVSAALVNLPEQMETLGDDIETTGQDLAHLSEQMTILADDVDVARQQLERLRDQVEGLSAGLVGLENALAQVHQRVLARLPALTRLWLGLMSLVLLSQVPALYLGVQMIRQGQEAHG